MKKISTLLFVIIFAVCGYIYATPYITLYHIKTAIENNDINKVSMYVDLDSVRQDLKQQLNAKLKEKVTGNGDANNSKLAALASLFTGKVVTPMIDKTVDNLVTIEGMSKMLNAQSITQDILPKLELKFEQEDLTYTVSKTEKKTTDYKARYTSIDSFQLQLFNKDEPEKPIIFILKRQELDWKVKRVILPLDQVF